MQALRRLAFAVAAVGFVCLAHLAAADSITLKSGEVLVGKVQSFEANHTASHSSRFVIEVDDETRIIPLHKIDSITFDGGDPGGQRVAPPPTPASARIGRSPQAAAAVTPSASPEASGEHWLTTSSHKRHNSSCRYYKTGKGRPCGPTEGTACKVCGG